MSRYERQNIAGMRGYTWGEQPLDTDTIKLNTNENPYPPSPAVANALQKLDDTLLRRYPQPTADALREMIADTHGITPQNIVMTNGGDEALRLAFTTFVEVGSGFGMAEPSYSLYPVLANIHDAPVVRVQLAEDWSLPDDFAATLNHAGVQLTCLVNPHAPSGTMMSTSDLEKAAADLDGILLIDEAYADFVDPAQNYRSFDLIDRHDNVLILRTFSKGYSLAAVRLGYLVGHADLIAPILSKTRDSYNVDLLSQIAGEAAFGDQEYAQNTWSKVRQAREGLRNALHQLGLTSPQSHANFLLVEVPDTVPLSADALYQALKDRGILVRYFDAPGLEDKLRISVGTATENQRLIDTLTELLT